MTSLTGMYSSADQHNLTIDTRSPAGVRCWAGAIRTHLSKDESKYPAEHFKLFKGYNRHRNYQMLEVLPGASGMPSVRNVPGLLRDELVRLVWFFTPNEASPIADSVRGLEQGWRQAVKEMGLPLNEG